MQSIGIYYFSGTGNTKIAAGRFRDEFVKSGCKVDVIRIEDVLKNRSAIEPEKYDILGIGSQIIGFGTPNIVREFVKLLPEGNGKKVFIFRTAGGVAPVNYNASKPLIRRLSRKGYKVFHERVFSIGSNWVTEFDINVIKRLYEATNKKIASMCKKVLAGENRILSTGMGLKAAMELAMPLFTWMLRFAGKDMTVSKACSSCGSCIKKCPAQNIYEKNGKIKFKLSCSCCMRCVYSCPQNAINFRLLKFFPVPGGYDIEKILSTSGSSDSSVNKAVPPFFNDYIANDDI